MTVIVKTGLTLFPNGDKAWHLNNKLHRLDGPACEYADGTKSWWQNDRLHRLDGPAIEHAGGDKAWFINGERILCKDNEKFLRIVKMKAFL